MCRSFAILRWCPRKMRKQVEVLFCFFLSRRLALFRVLRTLTTNWYAKYSFHTVNDLPKTIYQLDLRCFSTAISQKLEIAEYKNLIKITAHKSPSANQESLILFLVYSHVQKPACASCWTIFAKDYVVDHFTWRWTKIHNWISTNFMYM